MILISLVIGKHPHRRHRRHHMHVYNHSNLTTMGATSSLSTIDTMAMIVILANMPTLGRGPSGTIHTMDTISICGKIAINIES